MGFANTSVIIIIVEYDGNSDNAASWLAANQDDNMRPLLPIPLSIFEYDILRRYNVNNVNNVAGIP